MIVLTFDIKIFFEQKDFLKLKVTEVHSSLEGSPENDDSVRKNSIRQALYILFIWIFFCQNEVEGGCRLKNHGMNSGEILLSH